MSLTTPEAAEIVAELQRRLAPAARPTDTPDDLNRVETIHCTDGLSFSMQASWVHYCLPRDNEGPWTAVEIGFPSRRVEEFMPFIDGENERPTDTIYGYVPLSVVAVVVAAAGGLVEAPQSLLADRAEA